MSDRDLEVVSLGLRPYDEVWELQRELHADIVKGERADTLICCSHSPVITLGTSSHAENVLRDPAELEALGVAVRKVERGGDVTYHGPGQLVLYPLLNLNHLKRDVGWYMRSLEEVVIRTLAEWRIDGTRVQGRTGVWIGDPPDRKISSIGVKLSRWCSYHGLSLNVHEEAGGFELIRACGIPNVQMTSMQTERGSEALERPQAIAAIEAAAVINFRAVFDYSKPI